VRTVYLVTRAGALLDPHTGGGHQWETITLPLLDEVPGSVLWHSVAVEFALDGQVNWRRAQARIRLIPADDNNTGPATIGVGPQARPDGGDPSAGPGEDEPQDPELIVDWRVLIRATPSQPPSRVRVDVAGPDLDWCEQQIRWCWQQAAASGPFQDAVAIEDLFAGE